MSCLRIEPASRSPPLNLRSSFCMGGTQGYQLKLPYPPGPTHNWGMQLDLKEYGVDLVSRMSGAWESAKSCISIARLTRRFEGGRPLCSPCENLADSQPLSSIQTGKQHLGPRVSQLAPHDDSRSAQQVGQQWWLLFGQPQRTPWAILFSSP